MAPNSNVLPSSQHLQRKRKYNSDEGDFSDDDSGFSPKSSSPSADDDRRAHHNELERRRRDHIKDHFSSLKNAIPLLEGEKSSRALILKRAVDYIQVLQAQLKEAKMEIEDQKRRSDNQHFHHQQQQQIAQPTGGQFAGLINPITVSPQLPQPSFQLPSVSSAFMSIPSTSSVIPAVAAFPSTISDQYLAPASSSPLAGTVASSAAAATYPTNLGQTFSTTSAADQAKTALLSQLLLQNLGQLIQASPSNHSSSLLPQTSDFGTNNQLQQQQQQFLGFHEQQRQQQQQQLAGIVHL